MTQARQTTVWLVSFLINATVIGNVPVIRVYRNEIIIASQEKKKKKETGWLKEGSCILIS